MKTLIILTAQKVTSHAAIELHTIARTVTFEPGSTPSGMLDWAIHQLPEQYHGNCNVMFFHAEPDTPVPTPDGQP